jgi:type IV pilus assembly protein PilQ
VPEAQPLPEPRTAAAATVAGTPERPAVGPRPGGVVASALRDIEIVDSATQPLVKLVGDGSFYYSTFVLEDPPRFVIDLENVINEGGRREIELGGESLERVRVSQFRSAPEPVSRVVLDLTSLSNLPTVEATGDGLWIHFAPRVGPSDSPQTLTRQQPSIAEASEPATVMAAAEPEEPEPVLTTAIAQPAPLEVAPPLSEPSLSEPPLSEPPPATAQVEPRQEPLQIVIAEDEAPVSEPLVAPRGPTSDVSLFEAQEIRIDTPPPQETTAPTPSFGVRSLGEERVFTGDPVTLSLKEADITEVLRAFAQQFDLNIVIQPGVGGSVTVELVEVPWDQALDIILRTNSLGMTLEGTILRIAPITRLAEEATEAQQLAQARALSIPLATVMKRISYAEASEVATILASGRGTGIMSQRGSVTVDSRTNTLIIRELPDYLNTVIQVIENLDIPEKQVMIEARIVETSRNFTRSLGVQWDFNGVADAVHGNTTGLQFPNNVDTEGGVNLLRGGQNGFFNLGLGNILNTFQLDLALRAAETEGLVNVISAPKVATLNNESASIQTGVQIPIQTVANNTVSVQFVNATLSLDVTPHVTADGTILLTIDISKREPALGLLIAGATNAPITTREAHTKVFVRDGGTAVIGGIYTVSANDSRDSVPGLANIPILGHLFRNKERQSQNEELLIFITPRIIRL